LTVSGTLYLKTIYNDVSTGRFPVLIKLIYGGNNKVSEKHDFTYYNKRCRL